MPNDTIAQRWMRADEAAHAATTRLYQRRIEYLKGRGPKPTEAEHEAVEALHAQALRLYEAATQEFDRSARGDIKPD
jgi:hypothetical protein